MDAEDEHADSAANTLRIHDETEEDVRTAAAIPPFFRLLRELHDEIYELAALNEEMFYYNIELRADRPAQKAAYIDRGASRTFSKSQFELEYLAAVGKTCQVACNRR